MSGRPIDQADLENRATRSVACADCGRTVRVPAEWATAPERDRRRGGTQRRIVCHDRHFPDRACYSGSRHVVWAGLDDDLWALVSDRVVAAHG